MYKKHLKLCNKIFFIALIRKKDLSLTVENRMVRSGPLNNGIWLGIKLGPWTN